MFLKERNYIFVGGFFYEMMERQREEGINQWVTLEVPWVNRKCILMHGSPTRIARKGGHSGAETQPVDQGEGLDSICWMDTFGRNEMKYVIPNSG